MPLCRDAARAVSLSLLMCFHLCTCQGSSASYSNIHELGRYWISSPGGPSSFGRKGKRQRRDGQSHNNWEKEGVRGGGRTKRSSDSYNIPAYWMPTRFSRINILYLSWSPYSKLKSCFRLRSRPNKKLKLTPEYTDSYHQHEWEHKLKVAWQLVSVSTFHPPHASQETKNPHFFHRRHQPFPGIPSPFLCVHSSV